MHLLFFNPNHSFLLKSGYLCVTWKKIIFFKAWSEKKHVKPVIRYYQNESRKETKIMDDKNSIGYWKYLTKLEDCFSILEKLCLPVQPSPQSSSSRLNLAAEGAGRSHSERSFTYPLLWRYFTAKARIRIKCDVVQLIFTILNKDVNIFSWILSVALVSSSEYIR